MKVTKPIRNKEDINKLKLYFIKRKEYRNYLLLIIGFNTALRIIDILNLKFGDLYDYERGCFKNHITLREKKTGKYQEIYINDVIRDAFKLYNGMKKCPDDYIFANKQGEPISRVQAYRIIKGASEDINIEPVSCHSLRKTFGYYAWKHGAEPALLMQVYNHSSYEITKRYLGITQDDKDKLFDEVRI
ncbi:MAG: tyrosine-type recombinase/integrase [Clostridia bacterium]|nr:tyrosine-type recombinase/integrase [Clostridia bacterium]